MIDPPSFVPSFPARPKSRALVLGGGGSTGNGWLIGVLAGLAQAGVDVAGADLVVGTSAGATAAAQLSGAAPADLLAAVLSAPVTAPPGRTPTTPVTDHLDRLLALIASASGPDDLRQRIGTAALERDAASDGSWSAQWRTTVAARLPQQNWPEHAVVLTAVDARTGQAVLFDRHSGVDLADAVAASSASALPYRLGDRRLLDGSYRRGENADLAAAHDRVLVLSPLGGRSLHPPTGGPTSRRRSRTCKRRGHRSRPSCRTTRPSTCSACGAWTCPCVRPPPAPGTRRAWPTPAG